MKEEFTIQVDRRRLEEAMLKELRTIVPLGVVTSERFWCRLPAGDERIHQLRSLLESWGFVPAKAVCCSKTYSFTILRQYETVDFEEAQLLAPFGQLDSDLGNSNLKRDKEGRWLIPRFFFRRKRFLDRLAEDRLVISSDMREELDQTSLIGMRFREAKPAKGKMEVNQGSLWELTTDIILPPLSPSCELYDLQGNRSHGNSGSPTSGYRLEEGFHYPEEFHYRSSDMKNLAAFDFALTFEWLSTGVPRRNLVVTNRFYQFCKAQGLELHWIPVRIDPD